MPTYKTSLFLFRRDLRIFDNSALLEALRVSEKVITGFIFDPRQVQPHPYRSEPALQFMLESLDDLKQQLHLAGGRLALFYGTPEAVIRDLYGQEAIQAVFVNRDYTPFSRLRDSRMSAVCEELGITLTILPDALLNEPESALKQDGSMYKVFTPFYQHARQFPVALPRAQKPGSYLAIDCAQIGDELFSPPTVMPDVPKGGRQQALQLLERIESLQDYQQDRDYPFKNATSRLSAHLKFGTCSVREVHYAVTRQHSPDHPLLRELYWRDFFTHIAFHFPNVFGHAFLEKYAHLQWDNRPDYFHAWCEGRTGFPIVDAGMRELNVTGFMHNRVRMITASFLVKDLHIDWRWGERYFAQHLVDYDPCVNNGNWQWAASTGCDAQPYFRIFNPWLQQKKFDPDCRYIFHWLPELQSIPVEEIHRWYQFRSDIGYPAPLVDHARESRIAKQRYQINTVSRQQDLFS